jgi:uncharacterized membrane protein YraQ (UPF0718 family)
MKEELQKKQINQLEKKTGMPGEDMKVKKQKQRKAILKGWSLVLIAFAVTLALLYFFPDKATQVTEGSLTFFVEMILVLPAIMIMIGLITVWVPQEMILKYMGRASGVKGIFLSITIGSLPAGPLYLAFPLASTLLAKGASISNIIIFLSAWACLKIPQELMEIQFLGIQFAVLRFILTTVFVIIMGKLIEWLMERGKVISS